MKAYTNTELIENRTKWAKRVAPLTMLFLIGGLIINFMSINQPEYFQYAVAMLGLGFLMSIISSHLVNNWVREPRTDQALTNSLKKFGNDFFLFNYTASVPHVLLTPSRLYVLVVRRQAGAISVKGNRFSRKFSFVRLIRFFADEGLGVPFNEAQGKVNTLRKSLSGQISEAAMPEIKPLIIFTNKEVQLSVTEPVIPVLTVSELKLYLRDQDKNKAISAETRAQLLKILSNGHQPIK